MCVFIICAYCLYAWECISSDVVVYVYLLSHSATISIHYCGVEKGGIK